MIADGPNGARDAEPPDLSALSCIVAASLGALAEPDLWVVDLLAGNRQYRRFGARLVGKLGRPEDTGTLGALTVDGDPYLRAIAAGALAEKLGDGKGTPTIRTLLESALEDPGRAVPIAVAEVLSHMDFAEPLRQIVEERLQTHPAASVRLAASPAIY
jgi:HEAT repeat protein